MRAQAIAAVLFSAFAGQTIADGDSHDAPKVNDNPPGVGYKATLPEEPFFKDAAIDGNVKGFIRAQANDDGHGVKFKVEFSNLPKEGGPFTYHIHVDPVPKKGNCTATLAHLDPFARGEDPPCDPKDPASCQVGDLSGKHGKITSDPFKVEYTDPYASTKEGIGAFFGNRSFVLHYANKTRLTCANFVALNPGSIKPTYTSPGYLPTPTETINPETNTPTPTPTGNGTATGTGSGSGSKPSSTEASSTETSSVSPNGASSMALSINLALGGVFAFILAM